ncbi:hypothetical protein [Desulfovibrio gilichinskyi]|uniref:Uncharacterized protein n=1 Tax=Desulfovibrio gilichinskyi TaxID=1519643 RepID=A0A1X7DJW3_9BACT|nr:hypothetical protein [Desulfovibrio gilichinskyi]SMF16740.1 hypothetical protein SAMN06295933_1988 [Desulfovibrio gilichinskyi]
MQIQSTGYTQAVNTQYSSSARQKEAAQAVSSSSGDKVSISPEAKEKAQKMNSEKTQEELGLEEYQIAPWAVGYEAPCNFIEVKIGGKMDMQKEAFRSQHQQELLEYGNIKQEAYKTVCKKYNITKYSDYKNQSISDIENDFRSILAENPRAKELMEILDVPKKL